MDLEQVDSTVKDVVARCLNVERGTLTGGMTWVDAKADSLARVEITLTLEDTFHLEIPDEAALGFKTLADVVAYIHGRAPSADASAQAAP